MLNNESQVSFFHTLIIGGGAAGLFCASQLKSKKSHSVALIEGNNQLGRKIVISGGGRCNFTNIDAKAENYKSQNSHFMKSALSQFTPNDFIKIVQDSGIKFYEKKLGQLFCQERSIQIVDLLTRMVKSQGVNVFTSHRVLDVKDCDGEFLVICENGERFLCRNLVVAAGGLSFSKLGASDVGYKIAKQFHHKIIETHPALVGFEFSEELLNKTKPLQGIAVDAIVSVNKINFRENILFTHRGISGPAILQASLHWYPGDIIKINLLPDIHDVQAWWNKQTKDHPKMKVENILKSVLPQKLADWVCSESLPNMQRPICEQPKLGIQSLLDNLQSWQFVPNGTEGYKKAEVTRGGVCTKKVSSKTMESQLRENLYFIGEVLDITGWLGGYNFQWAWSSGFAAAKAIESKSSDEK